MNQLNLEFKFYLDAVATSFKDFTNFGMFEGNHANQEASSDKRDYYQEKQWSLTRIDGTLETLSKFLAESPDMIKSLVI